MADCLSPINNLFSKNELSFNSQLSPHLKKDFKQNVILTTNVTHRFLKAVQNAHDQSALTYLDIFNSQFECFQLKSSERLESRFFKIVSKVSHLLKTKYRSGRKRNEFLSEKTDIAVFGNEVSNVKDLTCTLENFQFKSFNLEKRASELLQQLHMSQDEHFQMSQENSHLIISEKSTSKKCESLHQTINVLNEKHNNLQREVGSHTESIQDTKQLNNALKKTNTDLETANEQLRQYVKKIEQTLPQVRKQYDSVSVKNKARQLHTLASETEHALWFSESFGLTPKCVKYSSHAGGNVTLRLNKATEFSALNNDEKQKLRELLFILDRFSISDAAYHELSMIDDELPRKYLLIQERSEMNKIFHISRTPGEKPGAYTSIAVEITNFIKTHNIGNTTSIKVKLAGDGTRVSRISTFVTFTLSFPDQVNCASITNIRTIAIVKCNESYTDISVCCYPVISEFNKLRNNPTIVVQDKTYSLDMFFNGDMKFIQICMGLGGSTSNHACPWCFVDKENRTDISKPADFYNSDTMKRTLDKLKANADKHVLGSKEMPLIEIEPAEIIPDELHLFLRISDVLMQNIIDDCRQLDAKAVVMRLNEPADHLVRLIKQINDCGVNFHTWTDKTGSQQFTSLTGVDYKKLFKALPDKLLFIVNNETHDDTANLIREISEIQEYVAQSSLTKQEMFEKIRIWMERFQSLKTKGHGYGRITPYMHCLLYHVPEFVGKYGGIRNFTGQGVEKMNDKIKQIHKKRSNKIDQTVDELRTRKRMEFLIDERCERMKNDYVKRDDVYWNNSIKEKHSLKRRRIDFEITEANTKYEKETAKLPCDMTEGEIKRKLKSLGVVTKLRNKEKLIHLLKSSLGQN